jgi:hypothetical protein
LKEWVSKYFRIKDIQKIITSNQYIDSLYNLLIESYPQIKENNILFDWEWGQCKNGKYSKEYLLQCLRELVCFRMNNFIIDIEYDLPKYLNDTYITLIYPKFKNHKRKYFKTYYEWACLSFPQYSNSWKPEDFGTTYAFDGVKCDSIQEKIIYEFIKKELNIKNIISTGKKHSGEHIITVDKTIYGFIKCCPDYIIEYTNNNCKVNKPIYVEYYGSYSENIINYIGDKYIKKTIIKNEIYKSISNIDFIDLYPCDLKHNFEGVKLKLQKYLDKILDHKCA